MRSADRSINTLQPECYCHAKSSQTCGSSLLISSDARFKELNLTSVTVGGWKSEGWREVQLGTTPNNELESEATSATCCPIKRETTHQKLALIWQEFPRLMETLQAGSVDEAETEAGHRNGHRKPEQTKTHKNQIIIVT